MPALVQTALYARDMKRIGIPVRLALLAVLAG